MYKVKNFIFLSHIIRKARAARHLTHPDIELHRLALRVAVEDTNVNFRLPELPHSRIEKQINPIIWGLLQSVRSNEIQLWPTVRRPGSVLGYSMGVELVSISRVEAVLIRVAEVRMIEDLVYLTVILERIRIMIHLLHVVVLVDSF